jgi:hypothetical protein
MYSSYSSKTKVPLCTLYRETLVFHEYKEYANRSRGGTVAHNRMEEFHRYMDTICPPVTAWEWVPWGIGIRPAAATEVRPND